MAEYNEKCASCAKANSIPRWGMVWPCNYPECIYDPIKEDNDEMPRV